jgi:hypothetical protein
MMTTINWCIDALAKYDKFSLDFAQSQLILDLMLI